MAASMLADNYHVLNVKDLLVLYTLDPRPWLEPSIRAGVGFLRRLDLQRGLARSPMFLEAVEVLRQYGRSGVPFYAVYPAGRLDEPIVLPEAITKGMVIDALEKAGPSRGVVVGLSN